MKIITYNVNGVRSAIDKGFYDVLERESPDIIGLQEIKAMQEQVDTSRLEELGYVHHWFSAQKKGYSGVALFSKKEPDRVEYGIGIPTYDDEGRVLRADFGDLTVLTCYFPSGTSGDERQSVKMSFLRDFREWLTELHHSRKNIIIMGDFNIAHNEIDIHDPNGNQNSTGFLPEERAWVSEWLDSGYVDTFRYLNPALVKYSWWSLRSRARANNKGWRIDYIVCTESLGSRLRSADLLNDDVQSDHCACTLEMDWAW